MITSMESCTSTSKGFVVEVAEPLFVDWPLSPVTLVDKGGKRCTISLGSAFNGFLAVAKIVW